VFDLDYLLPRPLRVLDVLQHRRMSRGLSQGDLAAELGVSRQTISSIENRQTVPSVHLALAIAIALGGTVDELFPAGDLSSGAAGATRAKTRARVKN
jgi:putative transcriptional regulator